MHRHTIHHLNAGTPRHLRRRRQPDSLGDATQQEERIINQTRHDSEPFEVGIGQMRSNKIRRRSLSRTSPPHFVLPLSTKWRGGWGVRFPHSTNSVFICKIASALSYNRSEEHTSELQSRGNLVC